MANKPISIEFIADVSKYLRDVKKMDVATEDIADALVAVTNSSDDLERKLGKAMKDAEKDTESLERAIKDLPDATGKAAREGKADFDKLGDSAAEAGAEVGDEFKQNLGESLSSGDLSSLVTDTLGGLVGSLKGPVGLAAAGIAGVAAVAFNQIKKNWEDTQQAILEQTESMWSTVMDSIAGTIGGAFAKVNKETLIVTELHRLWQDEPEGMQKLVESAEELGISAWDITRARAGDEDAIKRVNEAMGVVYDKQLEVNGLTVDQQKAVEDVEGAIYRGGTAWDRVKGQMEAYNQSVNTLKTDIAGVVAMTEKAYPLHVRATMDASELHRLFPYGTAGGTSIYSPVGGGAS